jgi:hypothetical protein
LCCQRGGGTTATGRGGGTGQSGRMQHGGGRGGGSLVEHGLRLERME